MEKLFLNSPREKKWIMKQVIADYDHRELSEDGFTQNIGSNSNKRRPIH
jgi:hypothetical protein